MYDYMIYMFCFVSDLNLCVYVGTV